MFRTMGEGMFLGFPQAEMHAREMTTTAQQTTETTCTEE